MKEKIIARREDNFFISYARWSDFSKLKEVANNLSEENKKFYHPWMFKKNPSLKIRIGQSLAKFSLIPKFGKLIKLIFPYGYAVILKVMSKDNQIVGIISIYNFKRLSNGTFLVFHADMISEKYQNMGLGSFQRENMQKIAKQEKVSKISAWVHVNNKKSLDSVLKQGWKTVKIIKNFDEYNNQKYDMIEIQKEL